MFRQSVAKIVQRTCCDNSDVLLVSLQERVIEPAERKAQDCEAS
jgi:hypothetical protein